MSKELHIWKYPLQITDRQEILVPKPAEYLSMINQNGVPTLYFLVRPGATEIAITIRIVGTGRPVNPRIWETFLGTVKCAPFVWHIFLE